MKSTKILAFAAVGITTLVALIVYPVFAQARMGSGRPTQAVIAKHKAEIKTYEAALRQWHVKHNYAAAETQLQDIVLKHRSTAGLASMALAEMCAEEGSYAKAMKWYRAVLVDSHPGWSSSDQRNPSFIEGYVDAARKAGSETDSLAAERLLLDTYKQVLGYPKLNWNDALGKDVHANACIVRAINRTPKNNGVALAQEAAHAKPSDPAIRWLAGMVLEDAHKYAEARTEYQASLALPGLEEPHRRYAEMRTRQLPVSSRG